MTTPEYILAIQLKETCRLTGARWCVCLQRTGTGWEFGARHGLTKARLVALHRILPEKSIVSWLFGAFSSSRVRSRQVGEASEDLKCRRLYAFPNLAARSALLVGADGLDKQSEGMFRILAMNLPAITANTAPEEDPLQAGIWPEAGGEVEFEHSTDPEQAWKNVLESLVSAVSCDSAWLSIRAGDVFRIEAIWNYPTSLHERELSIQNSPLLSQIVATRAGLYLNQIQAREDPVLQISPQQPLYSWLGIPVVIGQRVIGCIGFVAEEPGVFSNSDVARISLQVSRLAYVIENAIVLSEVTRYLQQLALLNELASAASLGADTQEVASRVIQRLRRTFQTERVGVFLYPALGKDLQAFGFSGSAQSVQMLPTAIVDRVVQTGQPFRLPENQESQDGIASALAVPLKYRGRVIGALSLESAEPGAFTQRDEQLLILISSHLAGLFENMRLSDETRQRASNLSLIHAVVQQVVGLTDLQTIAKKTVEILARNFSSGMAAVILPEENVSCILQLNSKRLVLDQHQVGVTAQVLASGNSRLVQDVSQESGYIPLPGWQAGSELCVALAEADDILGTIDVQRSGREAYSENDLVALEALAGVLSSVVVGAKRYQQLQDTLEAQRLAENRLVRSARMAAVGELSAGVAHELNNPLTTVTGFVELVLGELPPNSIHRPDLELVLKESLRARSVVRRLLDFARPIENQRVHTDLNELIQDTLGLVNHLARTGGVQILFDLDESLSSIPVDPGHMKQVFLNLIHNAIQAMPAGGYLTIRSGRATREDKDWLTISITDTGVGIAPENLDRLFQPFFTTRPAGKGTGLGLWVSYGIVMEHGGTVEVESTPGKGSCFTIYLPALASTANTNTLTNNYEAHG